MDSSAKEQPQIKVEDLLQEIGNLYVQNKFLVAKIQELLKQQEEQKEETKEQE